jgi:two-component system response regulator HydG
LIAATNRELEALVEEKRFREDLYYRINVLHLEVPPLRARGNDVLTLATAFVERFAKRHDKGVTGLTPEVAERLIGYAWPGNVRELQNSIERAVALARLDTITVDDLPPKVRDYRSNRVTFEGAENVEALPTLEDLERRYIGRVMQVVEWNKVEATRVLGIDRSTLYRKLERYRIAKAGG